jgi:hypothetical protein
MLRERVGAKICAQMARSPSRSGLGAGPAGVALLAILCSVAILYGGALAAIASAASPSLKIKVVPATVHPGEQYKITITGTYDKLAIHTIPYLLAVIQYSGGACKPTVGGEFALPRANWLSDFYPLHPRRGGILEPNPSFSRIDQWHVRRVRPSLGSRHVCAYLYSQHVPVTSTAKPLVKTSTTFRAVK